MTVPSKKVHTVRVPVTNWLGSSQKFKVDLEVVSTSEADDSLVLRGLDTMDVPGGKTKDYKMSYQPFKLGDTLAKVKFTNEDTGEYLFYDVKLTAEEAGSPPDIKLEAVCRQNLTHTIPVENPFNQEVTLQVQVGACAAWNITHDATITVAPQKEEMLLLNLRPLLAGDNDVEVKLSCAELGEYVYKLKLSATAAGPEGGLHFSTDLGGNQPQKFRFKSYRKAPTSYTCVVEDDSFEGEAKVDAAAAEDDGVECEVSVTFEPSQIGLTHATMKLTSPEGGDYIVNLHGECVPPKPKGPFDVKGSFTLPFKNVFSDEKKFSFTVDNPCFQIGGAGLKEEVMAGKKDTSIPISYSPQEGQSTAGKLVASAPGAPNWVFYLNGST
jgi:hydrocephalus-inducing protein